MDNAANRLPVPNYLMRLAAVGLAAASFIWLLQTGTAIFQPFLFALVVGVVFAPLADFFARIGAPPVVGALAVLLIVLCTIVSGIVIFFPVVAEFVLRVPLMWAELQDALSSLKTTMQDVENVQKQVADTLDPDGTAEADTSNGVKVPGINTILSYLPSIAAQLLTFVGVLYFFLLTRADIYTYIERRSTRLTNRSLCRAEAEVSRYFLAITTINAGFGVMVFLALSAMGMPNAVYWGLGAFLTNFVLYLGPIALALLLAIAGLIVFDGPMSFAPAVVFMLMNMIEGQFVTPSLVGRQMSVNPLLIFLSLVFWMWLWGPVGGVIAIPLLVWLREVNKASQGSAVLPIMTPEPEQNHAPAE